MNIDSTGLVSSDAASYDLQIKHHTVGRGLPRQSNRLT